MRCLKSGWMGPRENWLAECYIATSDKSSTLESLKLLGFEHSFRNFVDCVGSKSVDLKEQGLEPCTIPGKVNLHQDKSWQLILLGHTLCLVSNCDAAMPQNPWLSLILGGTQVNGWGKMMCQSHQTSARALLIASMVVVSKIWPHKDLTSHTESLRTNLCNHSAGAGTWREPFEFAPLVSFNLISPVYYPKLTIQHLALIDLILCMSKLHRAFVFYNAFPVLKGARISKNTSKDVFENGKKANLSC